MRELEIDSLEIKPYSVDNLKYFLSKCSDASERTINEKFQSNYFKGYFDFLKAKTIVQEYRYIDHDFLEDFAGYYVKCFRDIHRKCCRLHFFSHPFSKDAFISLLGGDNTSLKKKDLQDRYLGFIVVKPLPKTIIGRTCLKPYPPAASYHLRYFPITRRYSANLYGIPLEVETLAFQEQDKIAAACATSALWSVFQGTGKLFQHAIPSPVEITKAATENMPTESRVMPNKGLHVNQMAQAIRNVNLEPLAIRVTDVAVLKATVYAYLKGKIPLLLTFNLYNKESEIEPSSYIDKHAVAVGGYGLSENSIKPFDSDTGLLLTAMRVDRLYVHDDQIGPFAKMELDEGQITVLDNDGKDHAIETLSTSWDGEVNSQVICEGRAAPLYLLIPLYNKIRIPFNVILEEIIQFNHFLNSLYKTDNESVDQSDRIEWDIYLSSINGLKSNLFDNNNSIDPQLKYLVLTKRMPKYIWVCEAKVDSNRCLDLLFDATGLEQGKLLLRAIEYNNDFSEFIREILSSGVPEIEQKINEIDTLEWFLKHDNLGVRIID